MLRHGRALWLVGVGYVDALAPTATRTPVPLVEPEATSVPLVAEGQPAVGPGVQDVPGTGASAWRSLVAQYPWPVDWALATIACESSGYPRAYNPAGPYVGLFGIWASEGGGHRWTTEELMDPELNVAAAHELWTRHGPAPWPSCGY